METAFGTEAPGSPGMITPFSKLGTPIKKTKWWAPLGWLLVLLSSLVIIGVFIVLAPIILIEIPLMRLYKRRNKYHRKPEDLRVAIIGAGWGGLQCLERFKKLGVSNVDVYERYDDIGGTWHKNLRYKGLQIHGNMTITSFDNFPYSTDPDVQGGKVMGEEVEQYIHRFAAAHQLYAHCKFNSNVDAVSYTSDTRKGVLTLSDAITGEKRQSEPYDMVIWASMAAFGEIPKIKSAEIFKGAQLHTTHYKQSQFDDIIRNNKKVVIVGGGKAACDVVLSLKRAGYTNFEWVMRKPYLFYKYETLLHDGSFKNQVRGITYLCTVLWSAISKRFSAILHWSSDYVYTFGKGHTDFNHFHGGVMCPTQRRDIQDVPYIIGEPEAFKEKSILLKDGSELDCDVLIWAIGNQSGINTLKLEKDGKSVILNPKSKLYNHFIVPEVPVMASSTALWTSFGPMRGTNAADLTVYHLCVRKEKSERQMAKAAKRQMSTNSITHSFIWARNACWLQQWVYFHLDLMLAGITPFESFMKHALEVFVLSKETPLDFHILPKKVQANSTAAGEVRQEDLAKAYLP